jgi:hypothetical protein
VAQGRHQENVERGPRLIARSGLRFDKVALGFVARIRDELSELVPAGKTLVVTCTAPIRKDSATSAELVELLAAAMARSGGRLEFDKTIHGNRIRARMVKRASARAHKVVGFVHNPDVDVEKLLAT